MARPRIEIDEDIFKNLCGIFCTLDEIASVFHCSSDTIERWCKRTYKMSFADVYKKESGRGKISLRRNQFKMAEHNVTMSIWLGKQYLGQTDKVEQTIGIDSEEIMNEIAMEIRKVKESESTAK